MNSSYDIGADLENRLREIITEQVQISGNTFKDQEPLSFDRFAVELDGNPLYPRQKDALDNAGWLDPIQILTGERINQEIMLLWGKGSGKDYLCAKFTAWIAYIVLNLAVNPSTFFNLAENTPLHILNVAPNEDLARQVFFTYLRTFISSKLFSPYITDPRAQLFADEIRFPSARLTIYSKHSRSAGLDGYNLLAWIMDEADAFMDTTNRSNAEDLHNILRSSANSRMKDRWLGMVITYPRTSEGFAMRLYNRSQNIRGIYVNKASTFDINPRISQSDIGIQADYANDPDDARAKYECFPPSVEDRFFEMSDKIDDAVMTSFIPKADVEIVETQREGPDGSIAYIGAVLNSLQPEPGAQYFMGVDAGEVGDSFAIAVFHVDSCADAMEYICPNCIKAAPEILKQAPYKMININPFDYSIRCSCCLGNHFSVPMLGFHNWYKKQETKLNLIPVGDTTIKVPVVIEDLLIEIKPEHGSSYGQKRKAVDLISAQNLIHQLILGFPIVCARFDPWATATMVQYLLSATGIDIDKISFSAPEQFKRARTVKTLLYADCIRLVPNEKRDREWKRLVRKRNIVDHPRGTGESKDLYDAESIAICIAASYGNNQIEIIMSQGEHRGDQPLQLS